MSHKYSAGTIALMETKHNGFKVYRLKSSDGTVSAEIVPELGAIVSSLKLLWNKELREVLFQHPFFWERQAERTRGGLPFLFPVCGRMERDGVAGAYLHRGRIYQIKIHGFSMRMPWAVDHEGTDTLAVTLRDTDGTRESYPFKFRVTLRFKLGGGGLRVEQEYENNGTDPLPYYAGFHPYFLTPPVGEGKDTTVVEVPALSQWRYNANLSDIAGREAPPDFPSSVSSPAIHERLIEVDDPCVATLRFPDGMALRLEAEGDGVRRMFPFLQLYTLSDRPFFCVEPWMGFPNAMNSMGSVRWVQPGAVEKAVLKVGMSPEPRFAREKAI